MEPQAASAHDPAVTLDKTVEDEQLAAVTPEPDPQPAHSVTVIPPEHYEIGEEVARGGLGRILRARDRRLNRVIAIKELLRGHPAAVARFQREIRITARMQHPNIIPVHEAGAWPSGALFYTMKLVEGRTLARAAHEARSFSDRMALVPAVADATKAIAYAHSQGILHRDLKPANILVGPFGETVVIDWGLAKVIGEHEQQPVDDGDEPPESEYATRAGAVVGTPAYMPPEQALGKEVNETADVYALGAMLYHVLSGRSPYAEFATTEVLSAVASAPPRSLVQLAPEAPPDLIAIVEKAMARRPVDRYRTAAEMAAELSRFTSGGLVDAYRYTAWDKLRRFGERHRAAVVTAALALLALTVFGATSVRRITEERDRAERSALSESQARQAAERRVDDLLVARARSLLDHDPTQSVAWLKRLASTPYGAATVAGRAEDRGVTRRILRGHEQLIDVVQFSPDGSQVATAGYGKSIRVWRPDSDDALQLVGHRERVTSLVFAHDGRTLLSASYDGTVRRWDLETRRGEVLETARTPIKQLTTTPDGGLLACIGESGRVRVWQQAGPDVTLWTEAVERDPFVLLSADGRYLLTGSHGATMRVQDLTADHPPPAALKGHSGPVYAAAFSPDSETIASVGEDGTLRLWSLATGTSQVVVKDDAALLVVAFSPNGRFIAAAGLSGAVHLYDTRTHTARSAGQHGERVTALRFSPDGELLGSAGWDKVARLFDLRRGATETLRGHGDVVSALSFAPDSGALITGSWDKTARLWLLSRLKRSVLEGHNVGVRSVAYSPDGHRLASAGHDNAVRVWDVASGTSREFTGHTDHVYRVLFSPDGRTVASSSDDRTVRLWDVATGSARALRGHDADVEELAYSANGRRLVSASEDDTARLWNVKTGTGVVLQHDHDVTAVAFAPDRAVLATASRDRTVRLWDANDGHSLSVLSEHRDEVWALAYAPNGLLASSGADERVLLWSKDGSHRTLEGLPGAQALAFSKDTALLAVAGRAPSLWLCKLDENVCLDLQGHQALVRDVAFVPRSNLLISAGGDGAVFVWDTKTLERRVLEGHAAPIFDLALSPSAPFVASASGDTTIRLWPVERPPEPGTLKTYLGRLSVETVADAPIGSVP